MSHTHNVIDDDFFFVIDTVTRKISSDSGTTTLMQYDHNSERLVFEIPRYIEGHDMMLCNSVCIHYVNAGEGTNAASRKTNSGVYEVQDLQISEEDDNTLVFSWIVSQNATQFVGNLSFIIRFMCVVGSEITYSWNTSIFSDVIISDGIYNGDDVVNQYPDVLEQWKLLIDTTLSTSMAMIDAQLALVKQKTIVKLEQTGHSYHSQGESIWTLSFSDGSTSELKVRNGKDGKDGKDGMDGMNGASFAVSHKFSSYNEMINHYNAAGEPELGTMNMVGPISDGTYDIYAYLDHAGNGVGLWIKMYTVGPEAFTSIVMVSTGENSAAMPTCVASGKLSASLGMNGLIEGRGSFGAGIANRTTHDAQTALGWYNADNPNALLMVGFGKSSVERKNAFEVIMTERGGKASIKVGDTVVSDEQFARTLELISRATPGMSKVEDNEVGGKTYTITGSKAIAGIGTYSVIKAIDGTEAYRIYTSEPEVVGPEYIVFSCLNSLESYCEYYLAEAGMTWIDWVNSEYGRRSGAYIDSERPECVFIYDDWNYLNVGDIHNEIIPATFCEAGYDDDGSWYESDPLSSVPSSIIELFIASNIIRYTTGRVHDYSILEYCLYEQQATYNLVSI